jgi:ABC-type glycerol-3-phosphate transport system permease component
MSSRSAAALRVVVVLAALAFPLFWALVASVSPEARLFERPSLVPREIVLDHYRALLSERRFWLPVKNSIVVAGSTTVICVLVGALAAHAIARLRFGGRRWVLAALLALTLFPQVSLLAPLYSFLRAMRLIDTYAGLVLPYLTFAMPLAVWLLVSYMAQLPADVEDAARVDGAGGLRVLWEVTLPLSLPGIAATSVITFIYCWNEFLVALSFTVGPGHRTVPVALALFRGQYEVPWGEIFAAATVSTAPVAILVLVLQRRIVQGLTAGAVKG